MYLIFWEHFSAPLLNWRALKCVVFFFFTSRGHEYMTRSWESPVGPYLSPLHLITLELKTLTLARLSVEYASHPAAWLCQCVCEWKWIPALVSGAGVGPRRYRRGICRKWRCHMMNINLHMCSRSAHRLRRISPAENGRYAFISH